MKRKDRRTERTGVVAICLVSVLASCGSMDQSPGDHGAAPALATATSLTETSLTESQRIQAAIDARYTTADVRHSFQTKFGETIDCVDFFAQRGVKALAARGTPLTEIPKPPPAPAARAARRTGGGTVPDVLFNGQPDVLFNGQPDESGNPRACPDGSVPYLHIAVADVLRRAGPDHHLVRKSPPPPHAGVVRPSSQATRETDRTSSPVPLDQPNYSHVVQYVNPLGASSTNLQGGEATWSIYTMNGTTAVPSGDHSLIQTWMTSGFAFSGAFPMGDCSPLDGAGFPPCIQSVEVGTDTDPSLADTLGLGNAQSPHLFIYATPDGYNSGCYDDSDATGDCSVTWVGYPGAAMTPGMTLPGNSSVGSSGTPQYEFDTQTSGVAGTGWWIFAGVTDLAGGGTAMAVIGYYAVSGYSAGVMSTGTAQQFQAGGEVYNAATKWTVPMGSGFTNNPSAGFGKAAYVYNVSAWDANENTFSPGAVGPVTVPSEYTYSSAPKAANEYVVDQTKSPNPLAFNYFYLGGPGLPDTYAWSNVPLTFPFGSTGMGIGTGPAPSVDVPQAFPLTLGENAITLAPVYVRTTYPMDTFNLYVLDAAGLPGTKPGTNFVGTYSSNPSGLLAAWSREVTTGGALAEMSGVTTDPVDGALWTWWHVGSESIVYTTERGSGFLLDDIQEVQSGYTSVAPISWNNIYANSTSSTGCSEHGPMGGCVVKGTSLSGTWTDVGKGGAQVTADTVTGQLYVLDSGGSVWGSAELTNKQCPGGTVAFVQVAAKNGVVYGLDRLGTVDFLNTPGPSNCWAIAGNGAKSKFAVSIATDNNPFSGIGVWASDAKGVIWTAE